MITDAELKEVMDCHKGFFLEGEYYRPISIPQTCNPGYWNYKKMQDYLEAKTPLVICPDCDAAALREPVESICETCDDLFVIEAPDPEVNLSDWYKQELWRFSA